MPCCGACARRSTTTRPTRCCWRKPNQWPEDVQAYFGHGDECHMAFHFPLMPRIYMAIAQEDRFPITDIMRQTPEIPDNCQWAMFLRNHDELTLKMVTDAERDYLWSTYAADPRAPRQSRHPPAAGAADGQRPAQDRADEFDPDVDARHADHLLRRRNRHGRHIYLGDRNGVRTPMQWTPGPQRRLLARRSGGALSAADHGPGLRLFRVNVEAQSRSLSSLLSWTKRLIGVRRSTRVFGRARSPSSARPTAPCSPMCASSATKRSCASPTSRARRRRVELDLSQWKGRIPREMLGRTRFPASANRPIW